MKLQKILLSTILTIIIFSNIVFADVLYDSVVSDTNEKDVPCVATLGEDAFMVAWADGTNTEAKYSVFAPAGGTWSTPATITGSSAMPDDLSLADNGSGTVLAAWREGVNVKANFYSSGWSTETSFPALAGTDIDAFYDPNHTAWTVIVANTGASTFDVHTYKQGSGEGMPTWDSQTVDLADAERAPTQDTDMMKPSAQYDPIANQLVVTYKDNSGFHNGASFVLIPTSWEATMGEYGDGDGHDWGVPTEISGTSLQMSNSRFYINFVTGVGALAYEDSGGTVYITDYSGGVFAGIGTQVSTENPDGEIVNIGFYNNGNDNDGAVWWTNGSNLRAHELDTSGDPTGSDKTVITGGISTQGKTTAKNTDTGEKTVVIVVVKDDGGGNNGPKLAPYNPNLVTPTNSSISPGTPGQTTATVTWSTDVPTGSAQLNYEDITPPTENEIETDTTGHKSHSVSLTDLSPGTTYYYEIEQHVWGKATADTDDNGGSYYTFSTSSGGAAASPGLEVYGFVIVVAVGLGLFVAMRKQH